MQRELLIPIVQSNRDEKKVNNAMAAGINKHFASGVYTLLH